MLKCDPRVFARCPYKGSCVSLEQAVFTEGSDCEKFNQKVLNAPVTNGDKYRMMNDICASLSVPEYIGCPQQIHSTAGMSHKFAAVDGTMKITTFRYIPRIENMNFDDGCAVV